MLSQNPYKIIIQDKYQYLVNSRTDDQIWIITWRIVMTKNMVKADRIIRIVLAVLIGILFLADVIDGFIAAIFGIIALIFVITAIIGYCPLYTLIFKKKK